MKKIALFLIGFICAFTAQALTIGQMADSAYNKENYRQAIELYNKSIAEEGNSPQIYYNLGNAYFRNDNLGKAVLNYERALRLDPSYTDARHNLEFVNSRIQDRPEDDSSFIGGVHNSILSWFSPNGWATMALVLFIILLMAIAAYIFSRNVALRKTGFFGGIIIMLTLCYCLYLANESAALALSHESAVVIAPSTQLGSAPRASRGQNDKIVTIHEGTRVEIVDSVSTPDDPVSPKWYNVKINNTTKAWLRSSDVERI